MGHRAVRPPTIPVAIAVELARAIAANIYSLRSPSSMGPNVLRSISVELFRQAAFMPMHRQRGKACELPVQLPTKFELIANLKLQGARLQYAPLLLATADEVIDREPCPAWHVASFSSLNFGRYRCIEDLANLRPTDLQVR